MSENELQEIADTYGLYTEQDVKNRVSCELLSVGARNEELAHEVEVWKKASEDNSYKAFQLREENAALKKENESLTNIKNIYIGDLLKAKELLKDITSSYGSTEVSEAQLYLKIKKAEQFLNSEV